MFFNIFQYILSSLCFFSIYYIYYVYLLVQNIDKLFIRLFVDYKISYLRFLFLINVTLAPLATISSSWDSENINRPLDHSIHHLLIRHPLRLPRSLGIIKESNYQSIIQ